MMFHDVSCLAWKPFFWAPGWKGQATAQVSTAVGMQLAPAMEALLRTLAEVQLEADLKKTLGSFLCVVFYGFLVLFCLSFLLLSTYPKIFKLFFDCFFLLPTWISNPGRGFGLAKPRGKVPAGGGAFCTPTGCDFGEAVLCLASKAGWVRLKFVQDLLIST